MKLLETTYRKIINVLSVLHCEIFRAFHNLDKSRVEKIGMNK